MFNVPLRDIHWCIAGENPWSLLDVCGRCNLTRDLYLVTPAVTQYICTTVSSKTSKRYLQYFLWLKIRISYDKHRDFSKSMRRLPWYLQGYQFEYNFLLKLCPLPNLIYNSRDFCSPFCVLCVNTLSGSFFPL